MKSAIPIQLGPNLFPIHVYGPALTEWAMWNAETVFQRVNGFVISFMRNSNCILLITVLHIYKYMTL